MGKTFRPFRPLSRAEHIRRELDTFARTLDSPADVLNALKPLDAENRDRMVGFINRRLRRPLDEGQIAWLREELRKHDEAIANEREFRCTACPTTWRGPRNIPQNCPECDAAGLIVLEGDEGEEVFEGEPQAEAQP